MRFHKRIIGLVLAIVFVLIYFSDNVEAKSYKYIPTTIVMEKGQTIDFGLYDYNHSLISLSDKTKVNSANIIKAKKIGKGEVMYLADSKAYTCKVKIIKKEKSNYIGVFKGDEGYISIVKSGKKYIAELSIYRLCGICNLEGKYKNGKISFSGKDPAGKKIKLVAQKKGNRMQVTIKKTTWTFLNNGKSYLF